LDVCTFRNGDSIREAKSYEEWADALTNNEPAWCYYDYSKANGIKDGKLYNLYAVKDPRGLAPYGYHIPSIEEWVVLESFMVDEAGKKLKSTSGWKSYSTGGAISCSKCAGWSTSYKKNNYCAKCKNKRTILTPIVKHSGNGTNSSGFSALPGGYNEPSGIITDELHGTFFEVGFLGSWCITSQSSWNEGMFEVCQLDNENRLTFDSRSGWSSCSVRCLKDTVIKLSAPQVDTIGTQVWMIKNLDVSTFRNGDSIPEAKTEEAWVAAGENKQPAWCYYENDPMNGIRYGKLYNSYAVNDPRGLAPAGYHIPTDDEWNVLADYLGGLFQDKTEAKMKSKSGWFENENGTNSSGFSGLPGGFRHSDGSFELIGENGTWWGSWTKTTGQGFFQLGYPIGYVLPSDGDEPEWWGLSVRCVKD
jgi:uncharacterized protein (TIGR02145 family)